MSDVEGNEILSYGEGGAILFGLLGDVNSDGDLNILDVVLIVNFAIYNMTSFFFNSYLKLDYRDFTSKNSSELMRNVIENIRIFFEIYFKQITLLITEFFIILILLTVLFYIQPSATIIFTLVFSV